MPFSAAQLAQLAEERYSWSTRQEDLGIRLLTQIYASDRAKEFASHGLGRRLNTLRHCLDRTFESVPPNIERPTRDALLDATAFIQAFVINIYGAIDNLAHIWCMEIGLKDEGGKPLSPRWIGLMPKNTLVRKSLSVELQAYLKGSDSWFRYLEDYRHALAHRIPLYIPPCQMDPAAVAEFRRIEAEKSTAIAKRDWDEVERLADALDEVGVFEPYVMHSFGEQAAPMRFRAQMIADFATVIEIGEKVLAELESLRTSPGASLTTSSRLT